MFNPHGISAESGTQRTGITLQHIQHFLTEQIKCINVVPIRSKILGLFFDLQRHVMEHKYELGASNPSAVNEYSSITKGHLNLGQQLKL